jgi:hypothetical protein
MNRLRAFALAMSWPVAIGAAAGHTASAAPAPTGSPDPGVAIPADFVQLTDDTGTIGVGVPSSWAEVETWPLDDGPSIVASTDIDGFVDTFDVAGMIYSAWNFTDATDMVAEGVAAVTGALDACAGGEVLGYDDGLFVGSERVYTGCGSTGLGEYHVIVADPPDRAFTAVLRIKVTSPDQLPFVDGIRATFDSAAGDQIGGPSAPTTTVATASWTKSRAAEPW